MNVDRCWSHDFRILIHLIESYAWLLVKVLHPTQHKIGQFGYAVPSQSLNLY